MFRFRSVISRITFLHIIAVVATCIAMPLALYVMLQKEVDALHDQALRENAADLAELLKRTPDGTWQLDLPLRLREMYAEAYGRYAYAILDDDGKVLFSSNEDGRPLTRHETKKPLFFERQRGGALLAGASVPMTVAGTHVWIQVAEDMAHRDVLTDDVVAEFFSRVAWIILPILLVLLGIEIVIVQRGLRPVVAASELAAQIGPATVNLRLPETGLPREIFPIVHAVNRALARLEQGFRVQREFTADAAHELRTPLAILRAHADMIDDKAVADALKDDIAGMSRLVNQLLETAELETLVIASDEVADLGAVCARIVAFLSPLTAGGGKRLLVRAPSEPVLIHGNADALGQAVRNLAENALGHTAPGSTVEIVVTEEPAIHVADRGPGIAPAERDLVFRRFWRRDRRRPGSAGLGLAIVARIVDAHGGTVAIADNPGGGAVFSIRFPAAARVELEAPSETRAAEPEPVEG